MVWTPTHAKLHTLLRHRQYLPQKSRVLIAFSSGQDSLCLLQLMRDLQPKWGWRLAIAHCDHRWPPDSGDNAKHVARLADQWQLKHYPFVAPRILKGEAEGREWRYRVMTEFAIAENYAYLVTAHTASDRTETFLHNLMRGSGMDGLQALVWQRKLAQTVTLVRPLLTMTRSQTGEFCHQFSLPVWEDGMNQDRQYRRNRIRLDVLPYLREHFNPQVEQAIAQTAELLQADVEYLEAQAQELRTQAQAPNRPLCLHRRILAQAPRSLQRRAIRQFLTLQLQSALNFTHIEKVVDLLDGANRDRTDPLIDQWVAEVSGDWICLQDLSHL